MYLRNWVGMTSVGGTYSYTLDYLENQNIRCFPVLKLQFMVF